MSNVICLNCSDGEMRNVGKDIKTFTGGFYGKKQKVSGTVYRCDNCGIKVLVKE